MTEILNFLTLIPLNFEKNSIKLISLDAAEKGQFLFQWPATFFMENIIDLHHDLFSIMLIIASIVFYLIFHIIWNFRAGNVTVLRTFNFTHHTTLEIIWTLMPMFVLLLILVPSFVLLYSMDELHDSQITLKVLGRQWYWSYEFFFENFSNKLFSFDSYLLGDSDLMVGGFRLLEVDNRIKLPVEMHVRTLISATDVLHSWAMPSFGVKMDACPGRLNQLGLFIYRLGIFYGQCSEICGINHGFMPIVIESIFINKYSSWVFDLLNFKK